MPALKSSHEVINSVVMEWLSETDINADSSKIMVLITKLVAVLENERENSYIRGRNSVTQVGTGSNNTGK